MTNRPEPHTPHPLGRSRNASRQTENALHEGVSHLQQRQLVQARQCFEQAMLADPRDAVVRNCLGIVARAERRVTEAMAFFRKAIELRPDFAEAHNNMGNAYRDAGNLVEAADSYRRAIALKADFAEGHNNLGVVLLAEDDVDSAVRHFEEALRINPNYYEAHNNLATAYQQAGDLIAAAASLATALQLQPNSSEVHVNLASVLRETGQLAAAREHLERACQLKPDLAEAHDQLGTVLLDQGVGDAAIEAYQRARELRGESTDTLVNLGNAYRLAGRTVDALEAYERAAFLEPQNFWHRLRVAGLCPPAFRSTFDADTLQAQAIAEWQQLAEERRLLGTLPMNARLAEPSFNWQYISGNLRPLKEAYANIVGEQWVRKLTPRSGRPRIGLVVTGGHEGIFLRSMAGLLARLRTNGYDLVLVCPRSSEAWLRDGIARDLEVLPISSAFGDAANALRAAQFDVLHFWEVGTDESSYFLPFLQLAPVQCTSWGIQVTSGISQMNYYLSSSLVEPPEADTHYTEKLLLSPTLLTYQTPPTLTAPHKTRGDFGFTDSQHLYVCAQQPGKLHPDFDPWIGEILENDPLGVFVTTSDRYGHGTKVVRSRLNESLPELKKRIVYLPRLPFSDYLHLLNCADVLLDPPHFGGVNSTYDALAVGQPIVTLPSLFHRGRYTAACLRRLGVEETIARDPQDYVRVAVTLGTDRARRDELRQRIRNAHDSLFRDDQAVRETERLFEQLTDEARR